MNYFNLKFSYSIEKFADRFLNRLNYGSVKVIYPSGKVSRYIGKYPGYDANIHIFNFKVFSKIFKKGPVGFGESYIDGDFTTSNLTILLLFASQNEKNFLKNFRSNWLYHTYIKFRHYLRENTKTQSKKNIKFHYDLGNDFYTKWLDESMTYSSALFTQDKDNLKEAQLKKYKEIADTLNMDNNSTFLEIGCGWGGFTTYIAKTFDCKVDAITISKEQFDYTSKKIQQEGLAEKVKVTMQDYRDISKKYSRIASIEMFEAVGKKYWPTFFNIIKNSLIHNGRSALQIITIDEEKVLNYQSEPDFIQQYIFPGGMLPSKPQLHEITKQVGLKLNEYNSFKQSYAKTLNLWNKQFQLSWNELSNMGFNLRFKRMWEYYFSYCETGFLTGSTDVSHFVLQK